MKVLTTNISTLSQDIYLRGDAKYYYAIENNLFNLFNTSNNVRLSDIIEEKYSICPYLDDVDYFGIPTGQAYIDEDGDITDFQLVNVDNHPGRLKYTVSKDNILLSSLRLAKAPALNFDFENINEYVFSNGFYVFAVKEGWNQKFVLYLLRSKKLKSLIDNNIYRGIGISAYKIEDLYKVEVGKCSIENQNLAVRKIIPIEAEIKDLKRGIKSVQKIIDDIFQKEFYFDYEKFDELKKIKIFTKAPLDFANNSDSRFSVKFHRPAGEYVESELKRITKKKIKHFLSEPIILGASVSPSDYDETGEFQYLSMATIKTWSYNYEEARFVSNDYAVSKQGKTISKNDIILARSGEGTIGKVALIEYDHKAVFADFTMRIRLKNYNHKFAYYFMRSVYFQYLIEIYKKGLGNNTNIFPIVIQEFPLPDISLDEQQRIVDEIHAEISKQNEIKAQILKLRLQIDDIIENTIKKTN